MNGYAKCGTYMQWNIIHAQKRNSGTGYNTVQP